MIANVLLCPYAPTTLLNCFDVGLSVYIELTPFVVTKIPLSSHLKASPQNIAV
jgi:hypothetical protein